MRWAALGALSAAGAVAAGAFGAHGLRGRLAPEMLAVFETAVRYHLVHAGALLAVGLAAGRIGLRSQRLAGGLFAVGTLLFSGSLYALALTGAGALGMVTPLGGLCWLVAWLVFARALVQVGRGTVVGLGAAVAVLSIAGGACTAPAPERPQGDRFVAATGLRLVPVADGFDAPLHLTAPAGDPRLFVVEQGGRIKIVREGKVLPRPFLDLADRLRSGGERGLLSLAFHPRYASNGFFFVNYTDRQGHTRVERYRVSSDDPDRADPATARLLLRVEQPYSNHNGGHILFGPDGRLYIGMGDGGSGGDPEDRAQDPRTLLGKLLRVDVDGAAPVTIPRNNPFARRPAEGRPEIWALGLRNPWRMAFDRVTGLLYIADVGQGEWEEVHVEPADRPGVNYGWNLFEGRHPFRPAGRSTRGMVEPAVEYHHRDGCSITGGAVYRGRRIPALVGHYVFSDYCTGWIRSFRMADGRATDLRQWSGVEAGQVTSFGEDAAGELYVLNSAGAVLRLAGPPVVPGRGPSRGG